MIIFEFFSGIGGMHQATYDLPDFKIKSIYPFDINPNANITYQHNFGVKPFAITIEGFTLEDYEKCIKKQEDFDSSSKIIWTMSPPCQPFTRQGNEKDLNDPRTKGFTHLMNILENTKVGENKEFIIFNQNFILKLEKFQILKNDFKKLKMIFEKKFPIRIEDYIELPEDLINFINY